jgi:hypothetical protein
MLKCLNINIKPKENTMTKKIILITLFVLFTGALIAGGIYRTSARSGYDISLGAENGIEITQNADSATPHNGQGAGAQEQSQTGDRAGQGLGNNGQPQGRNQKTEADPANGSSGQGGQGYGRNSESQGQNQQLDQSQGQGQGRGQGQGLGQSQRQGQGQQTPNAEVHDMILVKGTVSQAPAAGVDMILETASGQVLIGTGPGYLQEEGFNLAAGDEVQISGFYENDEFKAVTITRISDGQDITLRDEYGRPFWSGAGSGARGVSGGQGPGQGFGQGIQQQDPSINGS